MGLWEKIHPLENYESIPVPQGIEQPRLFKFLLTLKTIPVCVNGARSILRTVLVSDSERWAAFSRSIASDAATAIVQRLTGVAPDSKTVDSAVDASLKG